MIMRLSRFAAVVASLVLAASTVTQVATTTAAAAAAPQWTIDYVGNYTSQSAFYSVLALNSSDVWAGGEYGTNPECCTTPLIAHWNGTSWSNPPLPADFTQPSAGYAGTIYDLAGSAAGNVWALATSQVTGDTYTLVWNGLSWSVQHDWATTRLTGLAVLSPTDVWAADGTDSVLGAWHYNGTGWTLVTAPLIIDKLSALSATDIWAEGAVFDSSGFARPHVAHWNGQTWSLVTSPDIPSGTAPQSGGFTDIAAASDRDVWVGGQTTTASGALQAVAIHWNGTTWTRNDPSSLTQDSFIVPDGNGGAWAADYSPSGGALVHYTGGTWSPVTLPGQGGAVSLAGAMSLVPNSSVVWSAGALTGPFPQAGPAPQQAEVLNYGPIPATTAYSGTIRLYKMGYCLDDRNNSSSNGAVVQIWRCNGLASQKWQVMSDGTIRHNGLCLDAKGLGTSNGTKIQLWACTGNGNQRWDTAGYRINYDNPAATNKVLDDTGYGGNGTQQEIWTNNGTINQDWETS